MTWTLKRARTWADIKERYIISHQAKRRRIKASSRFNFGLHRQVDTEDEHAKSKERKRRKVVFFLSVQAKCPSVMWKLEGREVDNSCVHEAEISYVMKNVSASDRDQQARHRVNLQIYECQRICEQDEQRRAIRRGNVREEEAQNICKQNACQHVDRRITVQQKQAEIVWEQNTQRHSENRAKLTPGERIQARKVNARWKRVSKIQRLPVN